MAKATSGLGHDNVIGTQDACEDTAGAQCGARGGDGDVSKLPDQGQSPPTAASFLLGTLRIGICPN